MTIYTKPQDITIQQYFVLKLIVEEGSEFPGLLSYLFQNDFTSYAFLVLELSKLEQNLYIKIIYDSNEDIIEISYRQKLLELFPEEKDVPFEEFWTKYHDVSKKPKTDKDAAEKYWKKLKKAEKLKAIENIEPYVDSVDNIKYVKKARTYLADKNFNDEFEEFTDDWTKNHI
jgi:hypothetical protein